MFKHSALSVLCCPRSRIAGVTVIPAVRLASGKEASVWVRRPWRKGDEKAQRELSGSLRSEPCVYWRVHWLATVQHKHHEDWFRTTLNWYHYSTVQKLRILADRYNNVLHSGLSSLSKGCCSFFASLKSVLDVGLKWHHCLVNIPSGKTAPLWSVWGCGELWVGGEVHSLMGEMDSQSVGSLDVSTVMALTSGTHSMSLPATSHSLGLVRLPCGCCPMAATAQMLGSLFESRAAPKVLGCSWL